VCGVRGVAGVGKDGVVGGTAGEGGGELKEGVEGAVRVGDNTGQYGSRAARQPSASGRLVPPATAVGASLNVRSTKKLLGRRWPVGASRERRGTRIGTPLSTNAVWKLNVKMGAASSTCSEPSAAAQ
jgi:hypothetical protein